MHGSQKLVNPVVQVLSEQAYLLFYLRRGLK